MKFQSLQNGQAKEKRRNGGWTAAKEKNKGTAENTRSAASDLSDRNQSSEKKFT